MNSAEDPVNITTGKDTADDAERMSIGEHLEELRRRLILALVGVAIATGVGLIFGRDLVGWICEPLVAAQRMAGVAARTYTLSPISGFAVYLKVSVAAGVVMASPWVFYQAWRFVQGGMYPGERKAALLLGPFSAMMAGLGIAFTYHILLPVCLWFFISFSAGYPPAIDSDGGGMVRLLTGKDPPPTAHVSTQNSDSEASHQRVTIPVLEDDPVSPVNGEMWIKHPQRELRVYADGEIRGAELTVASLVSPLIEIEQYVHFATIMAVGVVVAFQLPVLMLIVGWTGKVHPLRVSHYRKHCVMACFVVGTLLTPADILSMFLLAVPLWLLFEFGLLLMRVSHGRGRGVFSRMG